MNATEALSYIWYFIFGILILGIVTVFYLFYDKDKKPVSGRYAMLGKIGRAKQDIPKGKLGKVYVFGEYWEGICDEDLKADQALKVIEVHEKFVKVVPSDQLPNRSKRVEF